MHGHGGVQPDVGEVVNMVLFEGPALAGAEGSVLLAVIGRGLLQECAADDLECAGGLAVVMPAVVCPGRPGEEPDLEVGVGVELDPV